MVSSSGSGLLWDILGVGTIINGYGRKIQIWDTTIICKRVVESVK